MKTTNTVAALLLAIAMTGASQVVLAADCGYELNSVGDAIRAADFTGKRASRDEENMLFKLEAAKSKIVVAKYDDAIQKLGNIRQKAMDLADAPKPKLTSADGILSATYAAAVCINGLGGQ